jgi:hypothetical protein
MTIAWLAIAEFSAAIPLPIVHRTPERAASPPLSAKDHAAGNDATDRWPRPPRKQIGSNPMDRAYRPARSDKLSTLELATEHIIGDDVVAILDRSRIELPRRIVEAQ